MRCARRLFPLISAKAMATLEFLQGEWITTENCGRGRRARPDGRAAAGRRHLFDSAGRQSAPDFHGIETLTFLRGGEYLFIAEPVGIAVDRGTFLNPQPSSTAHLKLSPLFEQVRLHDAIAPPAVPTGSWA